MPNYPIAPWLRPADTTGAYTKGYSLGQQGAQVASQISLAQQRLAHDAQRAQVEVALRQQAIQEKSIMEQQRLEVAKAYHDQMVSLQQQKLADAEAKALDVAHQAALKSQAMQAYAQAIASGADPIQASAALFPSMGAGGQTAFIKNNLTSRERLEPELKTYGEGDNAIRVLVNPKTGAGHIVQPPKEAITSPSALYRMAYGIDSENLDPKLKEKVQGMFADSLETIARKKKAASQSTSEEDPSDGPNSTMIVPGLDALLSPEVLTKETKPKEGNLYQTPKGLLYFDGKNFIAPPSKAIQAEAEQPEPDMEVADTESLPDDTEEENA